jgi:pimeloyl-ACP methyl ester carboxylesterase
MIGLRTIFLIVAMATTCCAGVTFRVSQDSKRLEPTTGRIAVYVSKATTQRATTQILGGGEYMFGVDANHLENGKAIDVDDGATSFPVKPSEIPPGAYQAQAVLDWHHDDSNWRREPGNLYSLPVNFTVSSDAQVVSLPLQNQIEPIEYPATKEAEVFEMRSAKLSAFHHRDIFHRAGVVFPKNYDPTRMYPAIYRIPGFSGNGISVVTNLSLAADKNPGGEELARSAFQIWLDPESGNGHMLFANSDNNGPRGDALVTEFIPAIEAKYHLIARPEARIVRGHSSGGWASLWLTLQYPDTFGACFAASPDPVDFHCLEQIDIYDMASAYTDGTREFPGARLPDAPSVRQENAKEEVLGPGNTSGQDWDSWQSCWGRRDADGHIANLFDPMTGKIDHAEAESWRRYDITDLLRRDPERYAPIFHQRIRLAVGDKDTFFLNDAVARLKEELAKHPSSPGDGYIRILPGYDHSTINNASEVRAWSQEMLAYFGRLKQPSSQR